MDVPVINLTQEVLTLLQEAWIKNDLDAAEVLVKKFEQALREQGEW